MKGPLGFTLITAAIAGLGAALMSQVFSVAGAARAVWTSAILALVVQLASYSVARRYARRGDVIKGWGIGALMRGAALIVFGLAFFGPWSLGMPLEPALLSFAVIAFASTVIEPLFLSA